MGMNAVLVVVVTAAAVVAEVEVAKWVTSLVVDPFE